VCEEANSLYGKLIGRRKIHPPAQRAFTTADILIEGYLRKEGSWRKSWKTRYFILRKDIRTLCIFTSKDDYTLLGAVPVDRDHVVYGEVRKGDDNEHLFGIKPATSDQPLVLLSAPDDATKRLWLDALAKESMRTEDEAVASDWWSAMFGDVPALDQRAAGEVLRLRRRLGEGERAEKACGGAAEGAAGAGDAGHCDELDPAHESDVSSAARLALLSFAEEGEGGGGGGGESMDNIRRAMPDQDSDDEVGDALPPPPLGGSHPRPPSSASMFLEPPRPDRDRERDSGEKESAASAAHREHMASISGGMSVSGGERGPNSVSSLGHGSPLTKPRDGGGGGTPRAKEKKRDHIKRVLDTAKASEAKDAKQAKAKDKPASPCPLQYPCADRHETRHGFSGMKLSVRIENMCQYMDRFFLVIFAGNQSAAPRAGAGAGDGAGEEAGAEAPATGRKGLGALAAVEVATRAGSSFTWRPLSRTEEVCRCIAAMPMPMTVTIITTTTTTTTTTVTTTYGDWN
jgi:hypothetical protein